jgi:hypothetical protein
MGVLVKNKTEVKGDNLVYILCLKQPNNNCLIPSCASLLALSLLEVWFTLCVVVGMKGEFNTRMTV